MTETFAVARTVTHELYVTPDVAPEEVLVLARTRWPGAKVEGPGLIRVSRYTTISGPHPVVANAAAAVGVLTHLTARFDVTTLQERGDPPPPWGLDPTGISRSFPDGMPIREEQRVAEWLVAAARRLLGTVRFAPSGALVTPDPDSGTVISIVTDVWLEPDALLLLVRGLHPNAMLGTDFARRARPTPGQLWTPEVEMDEEVRELVHANADAFDTEAAEMGMVLDGYSIVVDLGQAGLVTVEVTGEEEVPLALRGQPWAADGALTYLVRWLPPSEEDEYREFVEPRVQQLRAAMMTIVADVVALLYQAAGGEIVDADGFLIAPGDL